MTVKEKFLMKMFEKSKSIINDKMDMINYLKFFEEHVNIKCLLFNDIRTTCLNFIEKPKLYENNRFNKIVNRDYEHINEIVDFYVKKPNLKRIDKQLFKLLPKNIQDIITNNK